MPEPLDRFDRAILRLLQVDASRPVNAIAAQVGLSATPCWRRIQRLRSEQVIRREVALVSPEKVGMEALIFAQVKLAAQSSTILSQFTQAVGRTPEIIECFSVPGDYDFILKIMVRSVRNYEEFFQDVLSKLPGVQDVKSTITLSTVKLTTEVPL